MCYTPGLASSAYSQSEPLAIKIGINPSTNTGTVAAGYATGKVGGASCTNCHCYNMMCRGAIADPTK